jgi:hypothetical protein
MCPYIPLIGTDSEAAHQALHGGVDGRGEQAAASLGAPPPPPSSRAKLMTCRSRARAIDKKMLSTINKTLIDRLSKRSFWLSTNC